MRYTSLAVFTLSALGIMIGLNALSKENLPVDNGTPSASKLPLDKDNAQVAFQTATFGLG